MKIKQLFLMAAIGLMATATFTSCEDILGEWDKPTPATVTPSGGDDDGGGSTPAVYTMAKDATDADKGKLICADGHIHAYGADAECTKARVAKIIYVGNETGETTYTHGLALALTDANNGSICDWKTENTDAGHTKQSSSTFTTESGLQYNDATHNSDTYPAFKAAIANNDIAAPTGCSAWFLASGYQWAKMITAAGGAANLKTTADGYTGLLSYRYFSSSEKDATSVWSFYPNDGAWLSLTKGTDYNVRSCLAF